MAINDVAREWVYHISDTLREFLVHNFLSGPGLHTLKPKKPRNLETKKTSFSRPATGWVSFGQHTCPRGNETLSMQKQ